MLHSPIYIRYSVEPCQLTFKGNWKPVSAPFSYEWYLLFTLNDANDIVKLFFYHFQTWTLFTLADMLSFLIRLVAESDMEHLSSLGFIWVFSVLSLRFFLHLPYFLINFILFTELYKVLASLRTMVPSDTQRTRTPIPPIAFAEGLLSSALVFLLLAEN